MPHTGSLRGRRTKGREGRGKLNASAKRDRFAPVNCEMSGCQRITQLLLGPGDNFCLDGGDLGFRKLISNTEVLRDLYVILVWVIEFTG